MATPFDSLFQVEHCIPIPLPGKREGSFHEALGRKLAELTIGQSLLVTRPANWGSGRFSPLYNAMKLIPVPMTFTQRKVSEDQLRIWRTG